MLGVMSWAEPANTERLTVIVVMGLGLFAAFLAWFTKQPSIAYRIGRFLPSQCPLGIFCGLFQVPESSGLNGGERSSVFALANRFLAMSLSFRKYPLQIGGGFSSNAISRVLSGAFLALSQVPIGHSGMCIKFSDWKVHVTLETGFHPVNMHGFYRLSKRHPRTEYRRCCLLLRVVPVRVSQ